MLLLNHLFLGEPGYDLAIILPLLALSGNQYSKLLGPFNLFIFGNQKKSGVKWQICLAEDCY